MRYKVFLDRLIWEGEAENEAEAKELARVRFGAQPEEIPRMLANRVNEDGTLHMDYQRHI